MQMQKRTLDSASMKTCVKKNRFIVQPIRINRKPIEINFLVRYHSFEWNGVGGCSILFRQKPQTKTVTNL